MEWIEKEASNCLKVKESWSEIRKSSVARCFRRPPSKSATRARMRNFVLDESLVQELLMIVEFGWCNIIRIKYSLVQEDNITNSIKYNLVQGDSL